MDFDLLFEEIKAVREDVQSLKHELQRYKGFVGGVAWSLSALTAIVGFMWGAFSHHG